MSVCERELSADFCGGAPRFSPEYIEFWAEVYERNRLHRRGLPFVVFLTAPRRELRRVIARDYLQFINHQHPQGAARRVVRNREHIDGVIDGMVAAAICSVELNWMARAVEPDMADASLVQRNGTWFQRIARRFWPRRQQSRRVLWQR